MNPTDSHILYDESKVPDYDLPPLLQRANGQAVEDVMAWQSYRRPELLSLFQQHVYGAKPQREPDIQYDVISNESALNGLATRKQVCIRVRGHQPIEKALRSTDSVAINLLIYQPVQRIDKLPIFLGLNFNGNHTIHADPGILISDGVMQSGKEGNSARGEKSSRWVVEEILKRGYALATICCEDMAIDDATKWRSRVDGAFSAPESAELPPRGKAAWGAIGLWAWGLSRAVDYFETDEELDPNRVAVMGHSRLGKTALWAGAQDDRFQMVISNNSGCGGAALSRRCFGETVAAINTRFPHWFCENFRQYNQNEAALPVDQHMLLALIAPRPLYVASAEEDLWADPLGEYLGLRHASAAFELYGQAGLSASPGSASDRPQCNQPIVGSIGYHMRSGGHDVTSYDWEQYMNFADRYL